MSIVAVNHCAYQGHHAVTSAYLLLRNSDGHLREVLHVRFASEARANHQNMKSLQQPR